MCGLKTKDLPISVKEQFMFEASLDVGKKDMDLFQMMAF